MMDFTLGLGGSNSAPPAPIGITMDTTLVTVDTTLHTGDES